MTLKKTARIIERLGSIIMRPIEYNGLKITISYIGRAKHSKTWVIQPHYHPWFEFNYVNSGSVYTTIEDTEFLVESGNSYIIAPGLVHSHRHNNTGDDGLCLRFSIEVVQDTAAAANIYKTLTKRRSYAFSSDMENIPKSAGICSAEAAFVTWLMNLYDNWREDSSQTIYTDTGITTQVNLYLKEYYKEKINYIDIAAALNISYRSLARRFKAESGTTISECLTSIRLNAAKQLLKESNMPMYDIAGAVGYENEFYFSKVFKDHEGISPSCFRRSK